MAMFGGRQGFSGNFFDNDPFFDMHREHMRQMDALMFQDPFGGRNNNMGITDGRAADNGNRRSRGRRDELMPFDMFGGGSLFGRMGGMMGNMQSMFNQVQNDPNAHVYSQSTVMSYSNDGQSEPKVYQASKSTRQAPGGIREVRKAVRDSASGEDKMEIGHHIGTRGHVIGRRRNRQTGDEHQNTEFIGIEESEAERFNREWKERTQQQQQQMFLENNGPQRRKKKPHRRQQKAIDEC